MTNNPICKIFNIKYPIVQAGMVWVSGGKLAAASANAGVLGIIGAGSMKPDLLKTHIQKAQNLLTQNCPGNLAVNVPLLYPKAKEQIDVALDCGIKIFFTSAGSPKLFTNYLKEKGAKVVHVTSSPLLAKKCEDAGVDAVVAEGFEAGGHNGKDELTTLCLIPQVLKTVSIPVIAAGGIGDGKAMAACFCLGAQAVQMGTRFMMSKESSAHQNYKDLLVSCDAQATQLSMKSLVPVRLVKNQFYNQVKSLEGKCASKEELATLLGKGRAKAGMLEGKLDEGELEAGQICGLIDELPSVEQLVKSLIKDFNLALKEISPM